MGRRRRSQVSGRFQSSGVHLIADLYGIDADKLRDSAGLAQLLDAAAKQAGATILHSNFHQFGEGNGVTGVVLLAESHISIHTWPESGFAALDIFMCGRAAPQRALDCIELNLQPSDRRVHEVARGMPGASQLPPS